MTVPTDALDYALIDDKVLVIYKWGKLSEDSNPRISENVQLLDGNGQVIWTVNGMQDCPYWDTDTDMFVSIGNDGNNWIINAYSGNSYILNLEDGHVVYYKFSK